MSIETRDTVAAPEEYLGQTPGPVVSVTLDQLVLRLRDLIVSQGLIFQPWQVAAFVTAARTKPFVILAGISGTGKTKITRTVASLTEGAFALSPVKPDWTDSSELLGYEPLTGDFRPGALLRFAKKASEDPGTQYFHLLDEMNIARVEYYFAEVLSILEDRWRTADGVIVSNPLISVGGAPGSGQWSGVRMPANLVLVGSVNMDETTHAFSRKVLDRAFVLEFADVQLDLIGSIVPVETRKWAPAIWANRYLSLAEVPNPRPAAVGDTITALTEINEILRPLQAQVGYRVRDEVALFSLNASECISSFVTSEGATVDPLDLAICMKVLPRLGGGGQSLKRALEAIRAWALDANGLGRQFVMCAARVQQMSEKLDDEGFTSYWL